MYIYFLISTFFLYHSDKSSTRSSQVNQSVYHVSYFKGSIIGEFLPSNLLVSVKFN